MNAAVNVLLKQVHTEVEPVLDLGLQAGWGPWKGWGWVHGGGGPAWERGVGVVFGVLR